MTHKTQIQWTHVPGYIGATLNPIRARHKVTGKVGWWCVHRSGGCLHCYAEELNMRFGNQVRFREQDRDQVEIFLDEEVLRRPLSWKKPHAIFLCDMCDLFEDGVTDAMIDRVIEVIGACDDQQLGHIFMILTKRSRRQRDYMRARAHRAWNACRLASDAFPPRNIWLGVSTEDQNAADERIPELLDTPAAKRFISAEPLLGPIDLGSIQSALPPIINRDGVGSHLDLVITGGESGRKARGCEIDWDFDLAEQCRARRIAFFRKQLGRRPTYYGAPITTVDGHGGDWSEWPEDLRIRQFPIAAPTASGFAEWTDA